MIGKLFKGLVEGAATPVARVMEKKEETKQLEASLKSKLDLTDQEIAVLRTDKENKSWKDEVITGWGLAGITALCVAAAFGIPVDPVIQVLEVPVVKWVLMSIVIAGLGIKGVNQVVGRR